MPSARTQIPFERTFTDGEFQRLQLGFAPESMDDRWFIFLEDDWLHFARSWTGFCVFKIRLSPHKPYEIAEAWANRDHRQYRSQGIPREIELLSSLIDKLLLGSRE
jgi:hypothetical protein